MLTAEQIKSIPALANIAQDAITALVTLSQNDEAAVIAAKVKEIHDAYDNDVKAITGREKPAGMKSYEHLKSVLADLKKAGEEGAGELKTKVEALEREKADLQKKIKEGATDAALKAQVDSLTAAIADEKKRASDLQRLVQEEKKKAEDAITSVKQENDRLVVGMEFERGLIGARFKDETAIPKEVRGAFIENAKRSIMEKYKPDTIERDGKKMVVFRDSNGMIVNNPDNLQNPFTPGEMLLREIAPLLEQGKPGGGTKPGASGNGSLSGGWRTKTEAVTAIREHLAAQGLVAGTGKYDEEMNRLYQEQKVSELPTR
jgi:hypothetical protein